MKKLLLIPAIFLLLPAAAAANPLDTYQYRQLESYVSYLESLAGSGFSDQQKEALRTTLALRRDEASASIAIAFDQSMVGLYRQKGSKTRRAFRVADRQRDVAKRKARGWYRENSFRSGAKKIMRQKIKRANRRISRNLGRKIWVAEEKFQAQRYNLIERRVLQNASVRDLYKKGSSAIDNLPSVVQ